MKCNIKEEISKSQTKAFEILPTIITTYGKQLNDKSYSLYLDPDSVLDGYNNRIDWYLEGFKYRDNKVYMVVSWSLDNADGQEIVEIPKPYNSTKISINDRLYFYIDFDDIYQAIKNLKF